MKLLITVCSYHEIVRNNIIAAFTNNTTIGQAEELIREVTQHVLNNKLDKATNALTQKTTYNELQARTAIEIIKQGFEQTE